MDTLICNKCFVPIYRGKLPYHITQCAHVFCQSCLQQVEKKCSQCGHVGVLSIPLNEPLTPKVAPFFVPLSETLELLLKIDMFRSNQMKITMQRFHDLDKKYEMLKSEYWMTRRNMKILTNKLVNLKSEKEKLDKKLLFSRMQQDGPLSTPSKMQTPINSKIFTHPSSSGYSSDSMEVLKSRNINPIRSVDNRRQLRTADGFRVPMNFKPPRSINMSSSLNMSDINSSISFIG